MKNILFLTTLVIVLCSCVLFLQWRKKEKTQYINLQTDTVSEKKDTIKKIKRKHKIGLFIFAIIVVGLILPQKFLMPVEGATTSSYNTYPIFLAHR